MAVVKQVIAFELVLLLLQFLLGNSYLLLPASPDCCSDLLYPRVALLSGFLLLTTLAAATILLYVLIALNSAQAKAAAAYKRGVSAGWKLRGLLLLAIGLSAASTFLAVPAFENGYGYRKGCVYSRHPLAVVNMVILTLYHGLAALLAAVALD